MLFIINYFDKFATFNPDHRLYRCPLEPKVNNVWHKYSNAAAEWRVASIADDR